LGGSNGQTRAQSLRALHGYTYCDFAEVYYSDGGLYELGIRAVAA